MISSNFHKRMISLTISLSMFMESLDASVINTAIPTMAHTLNVNPVDLKIALISYLLSLAIFIPISGWIADKFGIKRVFIMSLSIFTVSSLWCGFAHSLGELVVARIFQGFGGSFALPVGRLIILRLFRRHEYIATMNQVATIAAMGMMLGPVLGGFITHYFSWPWIFFINVPVGILTIMIANYFIIKITQQTVAPLDKLGFILFGLSLAGFTFGLSAFSETYVNSILALFIILGAILLFLGYLWHSQDQPHPIVKITLLRLRTFRISTTGNLLSRLSFAGLPFLLPLLLQVALGYSAQISGLLLAPTALGVLLAKRVSLQLLRLWGYKKLLILNTSLLGIYLCIFMTINSHTSFYYISLLTLIFGFFTSLQYTSVGSLGYSEISAADYSSVTSMVSTLQQLAQSFGVAISALLLRLFSAGFTHAFMLTIPAFHRTFLAMGIITFAATSIFFALKPKDGEPMIRRESSVKNNP